MKVVLAAQQSAKWSWFDCEPYYFKGFSSEGASAKSVTKSYLQSPESLQGCVQEQEEHQRTEGPQYICQSGIPVFLPAVRAVRAQVSITGYSLLSQPAMHNFYHETEAFELKSDIFLV